MTRICSLLRILSALPGMLAAAACGDDRPPPDRGPPRAVVVAGDFNPAHPGVLSTLDLESLTVMSNLGPAMAVGSDPLLRHFGSELFIINRADDNNITVLDARTLRLKEQLYTGAGTNPQDVAVVGDRLYVPTFGGKGLVVLERGSAAIAPATTPDITTIDLSQDDPDGQPNCVSAYAAGDDVYVACGLLDNTLPFYPPRGPGKVYVVATASGRIRRTVTLTTPNPLSLFERVPASSPASAGELMIGTVLFADGSGCVERIATGAAPAALGCMVDNAALGGYASRLAFQVREGAALLWMAVSTTFPRADLRLYDLVNRQLAAAPINASAVAVGDVAVCPSGELVVADTARNASGLRLYRGGIEVTTAALPIGLPPTSTHGLVCY